MKRDADGESRDLLAHVLLPVADGEDALATATALEPYQPDRVTTLHVVEKGEGVPDKAPIEQLAERADEAFAAVRTTFPDADEHTAYARDVAGAILDAAVEVDASAIVYRSRGGNRLVRILSGDLSLKLVTNSERPVIALPREEGGG